MSIPLLRGRHKRRSKFNLFDYWSITLHCVRALVAYSNIRHRDYTRSADLPLALIHDPGAVRRVGGQFECQLVVKQREREKVDRWTREKAKSERT